MDFLWGKPVDFSSKKPNKNIQKRQKEDGRGRKGLVRMQVNYSDGNLDKAPSFEETSNARVNRPKRTMHRANCENLDSKGINLKELSFLPPALCLLGRSPQKNQKNHQM
jgi:hypothetical protein